ncbi:MAG TPA: hypothetical protein VLM42_13120, partial [Bryobacteraceae bacterium]|nr:hypothetical protein [Bryobacteraceae bacterium]
TSPEIPDAQWIASRAIPPNNDYQWQVIATRGEERVTLPQPPENPPRFRILDAALSEQLRKSARANPEAHLLLGVEYGQAGAVDEARAALLQAVRENANADAARRLLGKLPAAH